MKDNIYMLAAIATIITSPFVALAYLNRRVKIPKMPINLGYIGNWNNQGQISIVPTHYVDLDARRSGKILNGKFNVRNGNDENSWEMFNLHGKKQFGKIKCKIFSVVNGREVFAAEGNLKSYKNDYLWTLKRAELDLFPKEAFLRQGLPKFC